MSRSAPIVAVLEADHGLASAVQSALEDDGLSVIVGGDETVAGASDVAAFYDRHRPRVLYFDVPPPYRGNLDGLLPLLNDRLAEELHLVVASTDAEAVRLLLDDLAVRAGRHAAYDVLQKPFDLRELIGAVRRGLAQLERHVERGAVPARG